MHLALTDLFRARWSNEIHEEWIRSILANRPDITREQLERTRELMNIWVLDCLVAGYEDLVPGLQLPDPNDRHVLAAAIRSGASVIVTYNLSDFPNDYIKQFGVEAQHPDEFITHLFDLSPGLVCAAAKRQRATLKNPPKSVDEFLDTLSNQQLPETVARLSGYKSLI